MLTYDKLQFNPLGAIDARALDNVDLADLAQHQGYVYIRKVLSTRLLHALSQVIRHHCGQAGWVVALDQTDGTASGNPDTIRPDDPEATAIQAGAQGAPEFRQLREDPKLGPILQAILGSPPFPGWGDVCRIGIPGAPEWTTPPHQDRHYLTCPRPVWTAWIPLMDCPMQLGPLAIARGSHRWGLQPHDHLGPRGLSIAKMDGAEWLTADFEAGDLVVFNDLIVHCALPNRSDNASRLSVDFRFSDIPVPGQA